MTAFVTNLATSQEMARRKGVHMSSVGEDNQGFRPEVTEKTSRGKEKVGIGVLPNNRDNNEISEYVSYSLFLFLF